MKPLTIIYTTAKERSNVEWFDKSLLRQVGPGDHIKVVMVIAGLNCDDTYGPLIRPVKPNVWQGKYRLTKEDWWAKSAALNTGICVCDTEWIAFVDDRSVLAPTWLDAVKDAMDGNYAVNGSYVKYDNVQVKDGIVTNYDITNGHGGGYDCRLAKVQSDGLSSPLKIDGSWWYGATSALPLEWCLAVNGFDETCDGYSMEDVVFGCMLKNSGFEMRFDPRMHLIEDRTMDQLGPVMRRCNKGTVPYDKRSLLAKKLFPLQRAMHQWDIRGIRDTILSGGQFPIPDGPKRDWYDGQPLDRMVAP